MNFRSCRYFLAVCEAGSIKAASERLLITQQSVSEHIQKLEQELGCTLFIRGHRMRLTEAGKRMEAASRNIIDEIEKLEVEIKEIRNAQPREITLGMVDYGMPSFVPLLIDRFLKSYSDVQIHTQDVSSAEQIPENISILFSQKKISGPYRSKVLLYDNLVLFVSDDLLKNTYGKQWRTHREKLAAGDLAAAKDCPFLCMDNTSMEELVTKAMRLHNVTPQYFPLSGNPLSLTKICAEGKAAMIALSGVLEGVVPSYPISKLPDEIPAMVMCFRNDHEQTEVEKCFWSMALRESPRILRPLRREIS